MCGDDDHDLDAGHAAASRPGRDFKASAIFTSNHLLVNGAIAFAGGLVMWGSNLPDLVLGIVMVVIAGNGGREILEHASKAAREHAALARR